MARPRRASAASDMSSVPDQNQELGSMYDYLAKIILLGPSGTGKSCLLHRFVKHSFPPLSSQTIGVEFSSKIIAIGAPPNRRRIKLQLWDTAGTERFRSVSRSYYRGAAGAILVYDVANIRSFDEMSTFLSDVRALASPRVAVVLAGNKADLAEQGAAANTTQNGDVTPTASSVSSRLSYMPYDAGGGGGGGGGGAATTTPTATTSGTSVGTTASSVRSRNGSLGTSKWTVSTSRYGREVTPDAASRWASKCGVTAVMEVSALTGDNVDELFTRLAKTILTKIELGEIDPDDPSSGIQYGDGGAWDGGSTRSGTTIDGGAGGGTRRRRRKGVINSLAEWEDVFRRPPSRAGRRCC